MADENNGSTEQSTAPKTFTQEDVDRIVTKRLGEVSKKFADYEEVKTRAGKVSELEAELTKIREESEMRGKSEADKAALVRDREMRTYQKQIEDLNSKIKNAEDGQAQAVTRWKREKIETAVQRALVSKGAVKDERALTQATKYLVDEGAAELSEDGKSITLVIDDMQFTDLGKAAEQWLKMNPHFASHPGGGSGARRSNGGSVPANMHELSASELIDAGWNSPLRDTGRSSSKDD